MWRPPDEVSSPTYTVIHEYGRDVYHVDLYRLETPSPGGDARPGRYVRPRRRSCSSNGVRLFATFYPVAKPSISDREQRGRTDDLDLANSSFPRYSSLTTCL
jgi:hypothetical protein